MRFDKVFGFGVLLLATTSLSVGCLVVGPRNNEVKCDEYAYEKCTTYCDPHNCWQECEDEAVEPESCPEGGSSGGSCTDDTDCSSGAICISGTCRPRGEGSGEAGICQTCTTAYDCADSSSRCVTVANGDGAAKICSPTCRGNDDCPSGFDCVKSGDAETGQCLPERGGDGARSCDSVPDLECSSSEDCSGTKRCVDNECVPPRDAECSVDSDCGPEELCRDLECVPTDETECVSRSDCRSDEICIDGTCESRNPSEECVFNRECDDDALCVDGRCLSTCTSSGDCNDSEYCRCLESDDGDCVEGICEPVQCEDDSGCPVDQKCVNAACVDSCSANADCGEGYVCSPNGFCEEDPDVECRTNAECAREETCREGECVPPPCDCNQQCPEGQVCDMNSRRCENPGDSEEPDCEDDCDCPSGESCSDGTCG